jgi:hypothetical protein
MKTRPTPETDAFAIKFKTPCGEKYWVPVDIARKLERELAEARGADEWKAKYIQQNNTSMNTQSTPETDQWEAYCDEWYYHMWRLRRKTERGWHDGFHIHTGEEAKGLCDLLNNLERERDEWKALATQYSVEREHNAMQALAYEAERDEARATCSELSNQ